MLRRINFTALLLLLLTATGGGLLLYHENNSPDRQRLHEIEARNIDLEKQVESEKKQKEQFKKFVQNLTASQPVAEVVVRDPVYSESAPGGVMGEYLVFTEVDEKGNELNTREFWIDGKRAHIDSEVIKFDAGFVESEDPLKGRSVLLFRYLYDQTTPPGRGHEIDKDGEIPPMYRNIDPQFKDAQQTLWSTFWKLADDQDYAKAMGVRVAQGEGVWRDFDFGYKYRITVDANGGPNIVQEKLPAGIVNALKGHRHGETPTPATNVATPQ